MQFDLLPSLGAVLVLDAQHLVYLLVNLLLVLGGDYYSYSEEDILHVPEVACHAGPIPAEH